MGPPGGASHHHALHVVSAGNSRATGFTNAPDKDIALYALYPLTAVILCVCMCVCVKLDKCPSAVCDQCI